jgi:large subunit ribosomal protein L27e
VARGSQPQEAKKLLEEKFKTGKNRWFFTKLRF